VGYGEVRGGDKLSAKFNPNHDELGRFTFGPGGGAAAGDGADGQWVDDSEDAVGQFQFVADRSNRTIDLREEDARGGHGFRDHVGKTDEYLLAEVERERFRLGPFRFGFKQEGSFLTPEDANDHVNRALEAHAEKVDRVVDGTKSQETINHRFGYVTGKEAYKPDGSTKAFIRPTYEIRIIIRRDPSSPRGFRVHTAFPRNKRAGE
jgi:Bacterial CdiA-CT RNAse A domain